jgi:hypothetical protein
MTIEGFIGGLFGGAKSTTTTNVATKSVVEAVARNIMNCSSNALQVQRFVISGDFNVVKNTKMVQNLKLSSDCSQDAKNIADLQQAVSNAIKQSAEAQNVALLGVLGSSKSEVNLNIDNEVKQVITQENIQNIVNQSNAQQEFIISGNNNIVDNFSMDQTSEIVYNNAQKVVNQLKSVQQIETQADQEAKATMKGPLSEVLDSLFGGASSLIWVIIAVGVIGLIGGFIYMRNQDDENELDEEPVKRKLPFQGPPEPRRKR